MNLLIVNDDNLIANSLKEDIDWNKSGIHHVWLAYDAETGKRYVREEKVDICLCDIEMPGESGIEFLRWIRNENRDIECIFLTCHASFEYAQAAIELGCVDYIVLPAKYEDILEHVKKTCGRITLKRQNLKYQEYGRKVLKEKEVEAIEQFGKKYTPAELADKALSYIMSHLEDPELSVNGIADMLYLHPVYLNRIFRKEKGLSMGQFISEERMKLAGDMLKRGNLNAYAVAEKVGYLTYTSFNRMFRKYYGYSPSQYSGTAD